jgi:GNAT superfamily N-acetyltransferase
VPRADVRFRPVTVADAEVLARHRVEMFRAMGQLTPELYPILERRAREYFARAIPSGEYVGWLAVPASDANSVIAGAGVQIRPILPRPDLTGARLLAGEQGLVLNVFTEVPWRRHGIAEQLMERVLAWARERRVASLVLHASAEGRRLYERLGFVGTNEMQYMGDLR